jgi:signal transduction histidine kinase
MDFGKLVTKSVDDLQLRAGARGVSVCVDGPAMPCEVNADWSQLARVLGNLLDNALLYTPASGHIDLDWCCDGEMIQFRVADSGPGIAAKDLPHLFTPLYRGETSRNRETGGAGLGLAIAQRILRAHGGDLLATNRPTGGAQFTGHFPII